MNILQMLRCNMMGLNIRVNPRVMPIYFYDGLYFLGK